MKQEFVTLPREVAEQALEALINEGEFRKLMKPLIEKSIDSIRDALKQPQNHVSDAGNMVPAGWKPVPVEPTIGMCMAGDEARVTVDDATRTPAIYRLMLAAAPQPPTTGDCSVVQPQANQPAMTPIAQRKLEDLMASGYTISGYSIYHEQKHQHGFVTGAGLVGWWKPEGVEYPQPRGEQPLRYLDDGSRYKVTHLKTSGYCIIGLPEELLGRWVALVDATDNKHMDSHQLPPTTEQSSAVQQPRGEQEPFFWYRPRSDGMYEGPLHKSQIERVREESGGWVPLYTRPQPKQEPLTNEQVKAGLIHSIEYADARERCAFNIGVRFAEAAHNIK